MERNQKPHSREKTTESGPVSAHKGKQADTDSRHVGEGGRSSGDEGDRSHPPAFERGTRRAAAQRKPRFKRLLLLVVLVIVILLVGTRLSGGSSTGTENVTMGLFGGQSSYEQVPSNDSDADLTVSSLAREKRYTPVGDGKDTVTVMIYMCGTDLESKYGMATSDLLEMQEATISDKVNIIVETGGCKQWQNNVISSSANQIYKVEDDGLQLLNSNAGTSAMTNPKNLTEFVNYCNRTFPADRNILIFWDHGGGSLTGYGYDEKNPSSSSMTLSKINSALNSVTCEFDWIGFDACLMATLETALVCNNYADYLIASEESEPGTGWDYTRWLTTLSQNTSIPTVELAKVIIDDFVSASTKSSSRSQVTLSIMDLAELQGTVPDTFRSFSTSTTELIQSENYQQVSEARAGVRQFAQDSQINQVDLTDLALRIDTEESNALAEALQGCVKYNRTTMSHSYGVSIYFPYESLSSVKSAVASYQALGFESEYSRCIQSFASLEYGGQITAAATQSPSYSSGSYSGGFLDSLMNQYAASGNSTSPVDALSGSYGNENENYCAGYGIDASTVVGLLEALCSRSMPADYDWVDTDLIAEQAENLSQSFLNPARLTVTEEDGQQLLRLTEEEWGLLQTVELNVFMKDGNGYIDLGLDNTFQWQDDDLLLDYDGTWLTLNGNLCAYYLVSDTQQDDESWVTVGRIPALLNGQLVNLRVIFDEENPQGLVTGTYPLYEDDAVEVQAKGDLPIEPGDTITPLCDYYNADGSYSASYELGESFTVPEEGLFLSNRPVEAEGLSVTYRLTDLYGNHYWLPISY